MERSSGEKGLVLHKRLLRLYRCRHRRKPGHIYKETFAAPLGSAMMDEGKEKGQFQM